MKKSTSETKKDTLDVLQKLLPLLKVESSLASSDLNLLNNLVGDFLNKDNLKHDIHERKQQI